MTSDTVVCVLVDGRAACWGDARYGRLGTIEGESLRGVRGIGVGEGPICVCTEDGAVRCWGPHGFDETEPIVTSRAHPGLDCIGVSVGQLSVCAATAQGSVECWGMPERRAFERLYPQDTEIVGTIDVTGPGTWRRTWTDTPHRVVGAAELIAFGHGLRTVCTSDATTWSCRGRALDLGAFDSVDILDFDAVVRPRPAIDFREPFHGVAMLDVGEARANVAEACASDGVSVECWVEEPAERCSNASCRCDRSPGQHAACELPAPRSSPAAVVRQVRIDGDRACVLGDDGVLWCWPTGTLGVAQRVATDVIAFDLASRRGCALARDGSVRCWVDEDDEPPPGHVVVEPQPWFGPTGAG